MDTEARRDARLAHILDGLVAEGVLTGEQADQVSRRVADPGSVAWASPDGPSTTSSSSSHQAASGAHEALRRRVLEAAVYVGIAFVVTAIAVVIARSWSAITRPGQIALTTALVLLALGAGAALAWPRSRAAPTARRPGHGGMRHRSASALLTAGALLGAGDAALIANSANWSPMAAGLTVLALMVLAHRLAPSLLTEVAMFGAAAFCSTTLAERVAQQLVPGWTEDEPRRREVLFALFPPSVGALWAWYLSRRLRHRLLAISLGLLIMVFAAFDLDVVARTPGAVALALVAAAALITYLRTSEWPWVIGAVAAAALWLVQQAGDTLGPAVVFLLIGLLLLAGVAVITGAERRRHRGDQTAAADHLT